VIACAGMVAGFGALLLRPLLSRAKILVMDHRYGAIVLAGLITLGACNSHESEEERHREANTPAGKLGQAAHKAAIEADKAGRVVSRKLDKAAHDAREGWKEAARKSGSDK
jgi:hypothetical protein